MLRETILCTTLIMLLFVGLSSAATIKTVPEQTTWYADGITEYKVFVYVDNNELSQGSPETLLVNWRMTNPSGFQYVGWEMPEDDFFEGHSTGDIIGGMVEQSSRWIASYEGVADNIGNVIAYKFIVPEEFTPGNEYYFDLIASSNLWDTNFNAQGPVELGHDFITVEEPEEAPEPTIAPSKLNPNSLRSKFWWLNLDDFRKS